MRTDDESAWGQGVFEAPCAHPENSGAVELLYAVRHGQSTANAAYAANTFIEADDSTIGLTDLGERQAAATGRWFAARDSDQLPDLVLCSPYLRAVQTSQLLEQELRAAGRDLPCHHIDQRLYDRHRGRLSTLSPIVVRERYPEESAKEARDPLGYRPPDGESFRDVADRLRGVVADLAADQRHRRVLIVAHDAVVLFLRQLLENLTEAEISAISEDGLAGNASITSWERHAGGYRLLAYDQRTHLSQI
ncbi:histidine phosphatase family protein [Nocardia sp. NPDC051756]|uniref:histidine phosphatase family protein n=1 Tax=Nocardia sp. NPDC051756 TaxID=3154751 RepID=UPI00342C630A